MVSLKCSLICLQLAFTPVCLQLAFHPVCLRLAVVCCLGPNKDDFLSTEHEKQTTLVTSAFRSNYMTILGGGGIYRNDMEDFCELVSFQCDFRRKKTCLKCNMILYGEPRLLFFIYNIFRVRNDSETYLHSIELDHLET